MAEEFCEQGSAKPRGKRVAWRRDPAILARLPEVERRHFSGHTNVAIGAALGISEATIRDDMKRLQELWLERTQADQSTIRALVVAELDDVKRRALAAAEFDEMCERAVLFDGRDDGTADDDEQPGDVTTFRGRPRSPVHRDAKGSAQFRGNKAAALQAARQATMDKAKVLGVVVDKIAPTNSQGEDISLDELAMRFAQARGASEQGATE